MKKTCCVVLNYNDYNTTLKFLQSVFKYKSIDYILVVDNLSTDGSYDILKKKEDDRIKVVQCKKNGGYGAGNNYGVLYAREKLGCDYVIISNPDVFFEDTTIHNMIKVIDKTENCAVVSAIQYDINKQRIKDVAWRIPSAFKYAFTFSGLGTKYADTLYPMTYYDDEVVEVDCVPGAMLIVDAEKFIEMQGYDERVFLYCEEDMLGYKIKNNGYKTYLLTKEHYIHEQGVSIDKSISNKITKLDMVYKSKLFFMKNYLKANAIELLIAKMNIFIKILILRLRAE